MSAPLPGVIRVLIVDDSALVRRLLSDALSRYPDIEVVGTARDPFEARERIVELEPDVITLDIEMPRMDGLTFLEKLMKAKPMRVIVVSSVAQASSANAIRAMNLGAVQVVPKPEGSTSVPDVEKFLIRSVRHASMVSLNRLRGPARRVVPPVPSKRATLGGPASRRVLAIGASTGGPPALEAVLTRLPAAAPGTVIVQHMPPMFTAALANRLDGLCAMRIHEATDNELIRDGVAYVAPGGHHLVVRRTAEGYVTHVKDGPMVHHQRPAVDVLFDSVADVCGANAIGVLLTGMGSDGARGMLAMKEAGAWTVAQDEDTCVVYGMPREAVELDAAHEVLPLERIAEAITHQVAHQYAPLGVHR